jgi:hypothetical protein
MSQFLKSADFCFAVINRVEFVQVQQFNAKMGCGSRCQQANEESGFRSREKTVSVAWPEEGIGNQPTSPYQTYSIWGDATAIGSQNMGHLPPADSPST